MVEYNDVKHNSITPDESDMYYENYDKQHYQDMLLVIMAIQDLMVKI